MKGYFLALALALTAAGYAHAGDYSYLTFETLNGHKASVPSAGLQVNIQDQSLTAGERTFVLSNLAKMYFTATDMTSGVSDIMADDIENGSEIYDLSGKRLNGEPSQKGVYLIRNNSTTYKVIIR